jgi:hypothetical protein
LVLEVELLKVIPKLEELTPDLNSSVPVLPPVPVEVNGTKAIPITPPVVKRRVGNSVSPSVESNQSK